MESRMDSIDQPFENNQMQSSENNFSPESMLLQEHPAALLEQEFFKRLTRLTFSLGVLTGIVASMVLLLFGGLIYALFKPVEVATSVIATPAFTFLASTSLILAGIMCFLYMKIQILRSRLPGSQSDLKDTDIRLQWWKSQRTKNDPAALRTPQYFLREPTLSKQIRDVRVDAGSYC